jgi:hypothetical protein
MIFKKPHMASDDYLAAFKPHKKIIDAPNLDAREKKYLKISHHFFNFEPSS